MPIGWRIAINNLSVRRSRTQLIVIAVALATSMVVAITSSIQSVSHSVHTILADGLGLSDLRIRHQSQGRFSATWLEEVQHWPETLAAAPRMTANLPIVNLSALQRLIDEGESAVDLDELARQTRRVFAVHGIDLVSEWEIRTPKMLAGQLPTTAGEVVVDPQVAHRLNISVGDTLRIGSFGLYEEVVVAGILNRQALGVLQKPELRASLELVQRLANRPSELISIDIRLHPQFAAEAILEKYDPAIPSPLEILPSARIQAGIDRQLRGTLILEYITIACMFLVCVFLILTGMTTAITDQIQSLAVLRCIGATRTQVFQSQIWAGLIIGCIGGLLGLPIGVLLTFGLQSILGDVVREGIHTTSTALMMAFACSIVAGLMGALLPAIAASRVSPLAALVVRAKSVSTRGLLLTTFIGVVGPAICYVSLHGPSDPQVGFWLALTLGLFSMVLGFFFLSVPVVCVLSWILSPILSRVFFLPPTMLRDSVRATPYRHGFTAGALMLGLASMVSMWSSGNALVDDWIGPIQFPDAFVINMTGIDSDRQSALEALPFIEKTCAISTIKLPMDEDQAFGIRGIAPPNVTAVVFEAESFFSMTHLEWTQGNVENAAPRLVQDNTILVAKEFLTARGIGVGESLRLGPESNQQVFEVVGVVGSPGLDIATNLFGVQGEFFEQAINCVFMSRQTAARCFDRADVQMIQFDLSDEISDSEAHAQVLAAVGAAQWGSGRMIKHFLLTAAHDLMSTISLLAVLGMMIAGIGAGNVIAANVAARRFEYGVLRAIGAKRSVLARLILAEALIIAIGACIIGIAMGMFDAAGNVAYFYRIMAGLELSPEVPFGPAAFGAAILIAIAFVASMPPVIRMLRIEPLTLLQGMED